MEQNQNPAQTTNPAQKPAAAGKGNSATWIIMSFVALLAVAIVVWGMMLVNSSRGGMQPMMDATTIQDPETITFGPDDAATTALTAQGSSDEVADIEADLKATDMGALDGIDQI